MRMYAHFEALPVSTVFCLNGNLYRKQSTRTAALVHCSAKFIYGRWFYFGKKELCIVGPYSLL